MSRCKNPILSGFYPDPSICRVGERYYLVTSTFSYFPGVPIFESEDLINWTQIGNVLDRRSQLPLMGSEHSEGIFAPTIRYHEGTWYLITTNMSGGGNFLVTAKCPKGPWSEPCYLGEGASGFDPSLFFDDDGVCYYIGTRPNSDGVEYTGDWEIWMQKLDLQEMKLAGSAPRVWKGSQRDVVWPEGPHLYKKDGYYYILHAEGGTALNHCVAVARSRSPFGPYENHRKNPIFTHRHLGKGYPIIAVGHGDLVETPEGDWYLVLLASRTCDGYVNMGRETFLAKVVWEDGWPVINPGSGLLDETLPITQPDCLAERKTDRRVYDFRTEESSYEFMYLRNPDEGMYEVNAQTGGIKLNYAKEQIGDRVSPAFLAVRQKHFCYNVTVDILPQGRYEWEHAGLVLMQSDDYHIRFMHYQENGRYYAEVIKHVKEKELSLGRSEIPAGKAVLKLEAERLTANFSYQENGVWKRVVGEVDTHELSTEVAGGFVGCTIGIYASANGNSSQQKVEFQNFIYEGKN